jgi:hypothetical protein
MRQGNLGFCGNCGELGRSYPFRMSPPRRGLTSPRRRGGVGERQGGDMRRGGLGFCSRCGEGECGPPAAPHLRATVGPRLGAEAGRTMAAKARCGSGG